MMIEGSRCGSCGRVSVPPEPVCLACQADTGSTEVEPRASVLAVTTLRDERHVVLVELAEGARLLAISDAPSLVGTTGNVADARGTFRFTPDAP